MNEMYRYDFRGGACHTNGSFYSPKALITTIDEPPFSLETEIYIFVTELLDRYNDILQR